jgi:hypothetical protein
MGNHNSLEVYTSVFKRLLYDIATAYVDSEPDLDWTKVQKRLQSEGISFLTKSLPRLGKSFDKALSSQDAFLPVGFKSTGNIPKFLGWLFKRVVSDDGRVRSDADIQAVKHIRQLLYLLYKLELPYAQKDTERVLEAFTEVDQEMANLQIDHDHPVIKRARSFITRVLSCSCPKDIIPRHGPGSVSTGEIGCEKSHFSRYYPHLEAWYPFSEYFSLSTQVVDQYDRWESLESKEFGTAKVVLVPKDSRGPRLISCEPLELQWIQQGQQRKLYDLLESHSLTKGQINFLDQSVNRRLALSSSLDGEYVTLDMKDASDRVSLHLFEALFKDTEWYPYLLASRSAVTTMPDGSVVRLAKFAPMGSACCFPIEALIFYALSLATVVTQTSTFPQVAGKHIFVYGDDIICQRKVYPLIMQSLSEFGLKFNTSKCCVSGFFRESCGCDAFKGVDVTPIRLRKTWNRRATEDATQLVSYVEFCNSMRTAGYRSVATYIHHLVENLYGTLPYVEYHRTRDTSSQEYYHRAGRVIGWYDPDVNPITLNRNRRCKSRFSSLHRYEVFGYVVLPFLAKPGREDGWEACLRTLCTGSTGLPRSVYAVAHRSRLQRGWGSALL